MVVTPKLMHALNLAKTSHHFSSFRSLVLDHRCVRLSDRGNLNIVKNGMVVLRYLAVLSIVVATIATTEEAATATLLPNCDTPDVILILTFISVSASVKLLSFSICIGHIS